MKPDASIGLGPLDVAIIVTSLGIVILLGLWASRRSAETAQGYFLAAGKLPWWLIGTALVATSISSEQIVGTMGAAYKYGMGIANWEWFSLPGYTVVMIFFIPVYLKYRITTVPAYLSRRFGPRCGDIYTWVMLLAYVFVYMVVILYGGTLAFSQLTGLNFFLVLWLTAILVGLYTVKGGLMSVVWADAGQCVMLVGGGVVLFLVALSKVPGGWSAMVRSEPSRFHLYHPVNDPIAPFLGLIFLSIGLGPFYQGTSQVMVQRVLGARSTWDGIMGTIFAGFINFLRPLVTVFSGFVAYHWIYEMHMAQPLANPDTTFPFVLRTVGPIWGVRGIVLAGFLAAVMSAISALTNSTATIFALDLYKKVLNKSAEDRKVVRVGRLASLGALGVASLFAPLVERMGGIFRYFQTSVTYLATPFISVILLGLLWKRTNYQGAIFGLLGGIVIQASVVAANALLGLNLHWLYLGFAGQVITMTGIVLVTLWTQPAAPAAEEVPCWNRDLLLQYDEGMARPWFKSLKLWYGIYASIWFYLYWRFW